MANKHMKRSSMWLILRNINQNYNKVSPHTNQNYQHQKIYEWYILETIWRKGNSPTLLV